MRLRLIRDPNCGPDGTTGHFELSPIIYTLERPWVEAAYMSLAPGYVPCGARGVSCIPAGIYQLEAHDTDAHPSTFALINHNLWVYHFEADVPPDRKGYARTAVLIHPANYVEELRGCIAPGLHHSGVIVSDSRAAFAMLRPYLKDAKQIEIVSA
jgi:hypothetical protein